MKKRILSILLTLCMVLCLVPAGVFAEGGASDGSSAIRYGTDGIHGYSAESGYNYIYYGTWNGSPLKWRVLDSQTNMGTTGLFLLSEELLGSGNTGGIKFGYDDEDTWQGSKVQAWCRDFAGIEGDSVPDAFTAAELAAILETSKSDPEYFTPTEKVVIDGREWTLAGAHFLEVENALDGDKVFFLSAAEAKNAAYGLADVEARAGKYNGKEAYWWLRSPAADRYAGYVDYLGYVYPTLRNDPHAARPAFNLDSGSVLFASAAVGGKTDGFGAVGTYSGSEWKLTVKDSERDGFSVARKSVFAGGVTFEYKNAKTGENEYISAMVTNGGEIKYYGRLKKVSSADMENGTLTVSLPSDYNEESGDRLFIFNEQCNGDYNTDYASTPLRLSTDDTGASLVQIRINSVTGEWEVSYDDGATWTSLGVKATGEKGDKGDKGDPGQNGAPGKDGVDGRDGKDGTTPMLKIGDDNIWYVSYDGGQSWTSLGVKATGEKGDKGDKGDPGQNGVDGKDGAPGKDGVDGRDGKDGTTPMLKIGDDNIWYVSYDGGQSWTSLGVNATGADGKDGADGKNGIDGKDGKNGVDGKDGDKGDKGDKGDAGKDGKDGLAPSIGENGNWWIGEKDTGVKAVADAAVPAGFGNISASSPALIVIGSVAGLALLGNLGLILYIVLKKKKGLV